MIKNSSAAELFKRIAPFILVISVFVIYLFSMAPGFTWAHDGADGGDLITAAATGGVAHPSGYPTFLLLAHLFQLLPLGTIAYRTNLMSAVFTALTVLLVYDIVVASPKSPANGMPLAGLIAGFAYGLSPLAWSQAVITEVYALHLFFVTLVLWLLLGRFAYSSNKSLLDVVIGLAMGLAMGDHLTSVFLLPAALLAGMLIPPSSDPKSKKDTRAKKAVGVSLDWASLGRRLGFVCVGLLVYSFILWRAGSGAPVNWGHASDIPNLWWLVSGALYQHYAFSVPLEDAFMRVISVAQLLLTQFGVLGLLAGCYHLFGKSSLSRLPLITAWVALTNVIFSLGYATIDSYIYLLPFFLVFAIWIGFGIGNITTRLARQSHWMSLGIGAVLLASIWIIGGMNYPKLDLSGDHQAEKFEKVVSATLPPQAIVVAKGDQALFTMWYDHFVLKDRQDIAVLADGLLTYPWYIDILHTTYPTLNISLDDVQSETIAQVNPTRPFCNVMILDDQMSVDCYPPGSQSSASPYISITQPLGQ